MWLIGAMVCLLAAPWVQLSVSAGNGWPHNALRHHWFMPVSCHFRDCKALLVTSMTHVSGAITSVLTFTFLPLKFHMKIFYVAAGARLLQPKWIRIALLQNPLPCTVCTPPQEIMALVAYTIWQFYLFTMQKNREGLFGGTFIDKFGAFGANLQERCRHLLKVGVKI